MNTPIIWPSDFTLWVKITTLFIDFPTVLIFCHRFPLSFNQSPFLYHTGLRGMKLINALQMLERFNDTMESLHRLTGNSDRYYQLVNTANTELGLITDKVEKIMKRESVHRDDV